MLDRYTEENSSLLFAGKDIRQLLEESGWARARDMWWAFLPPETCHLNFFAHHVRPGISLIEVLKDQNGGFSARVYTDPLDDHVPTAVIGDVNAVARAAYYDKVPMIGLYEGDEIQLGSVRLVYPKDYISLPNVDKALKATKAYCMLRRSSFLLSCVLPVMFGGNNACLQVYTNRVAPEGDTFFAIISPDLSPDMRSNRVLVTDSSSYRNRHNGQYVFQNL